MHVYNTWVGIVSQVFRTTGNQISDLILGYMGNMHFIWKLSYAQGPDFLACETLHFSWRSRACKVVWEALHFFMVSQEQTRSNRICSFQNFEVCYTGKRSIRLDNLWYNSNHKNNMFGNQMKSLLEFHESFTNVEMVYSHVYPVKTKHFLTFLRVFALCLA